MLEPRLLKDGERQVAGKVVHDSVQDIRRVVVAVKVSLKEIGPISLLPKMPHHTLTDHLTV